MGTTTTPNLGLVKPDGSEPASNWPTQVAANYDTLDAIPFNSLELLAEAGSATNRNHTASAAFTGNGDGTTFVAPNTGKVLIMLRDRMDFEKAGTGSVITRSLMGSVRVGTGGTIGAGTEVLAPSANYANEVGSKSSSTDGDLATGSIWLTVSGLTPGNTYNIEHQYQVNSTANVNAATSLNRRVAVFAMK